MTKTMTAAASAASGARNVWRSAALAGLAMAALLMAGLCGTASGQWRPSDNNNNNRTNTSQPRRTPPTTTTTKGTPRAPDATTQTQPENQLQIPAPTGTLVPPKAVDDGGFAEAMKAAALGVVRINTDKGRLIGFIIGGPDKERWLTVTNYLAIAECKWVEIRTFDGTKIEVEGLLNFDEQQDLALISVKASKNTKIKPLELAEKDAKEGDKVYAIGFKQGEADWAAAGKVAKVAPGAGLEQPPESTWVFTDEIISETNRGGPLMDGNRRVVGLCTSPGKYGRGPHLSSPVSKIRELAAKESYGPQLRYPEPKGSFRWPAAKARKQEVYELSKIQTATVGAKRALECTTCQGYGYMIVPQFTVDQRTGKKTPAGETQESCTDCGGTGSVVKASVFELLNTISNYYLNRDPKLEESEATKLQTLVAEAFDRAAVNRLTLANALTPSANKILEDVKPDQDQPVTFLAILGPMMRFNNTDYQWVQSYDSKVWVMARGAQVRNANAPAPAAGTGGGGVIRRPASGPVTSSSGRYVLVSGLLEGYTTINPQANQIYHAPLIRAAEIVSLRN